MTKEKSIATYTLGCKVNQYETNAVEEIFTDRGYTLLDFEEKADVYLINTCTVTAMSDKKSRQIIRRAKKSNKDALVVVMGCYAQNDPDAVIQIEDVNLVMGTKDKNKIYQEVEKLTAGDKIVKVTDIMEEKDFENLQIRQYAKNTRAFVKIQDGCDRYCTYCIIPYTRGKIRSRKIEDIVKEVELLAENGYKEVVLTGIHVASYGKDFKLLAMGEKEKDLPPEKTNLIDVIEAIAKIEGIERIRTSSVEPLIIRKELLERLSKVEKFCPHFHLSLQSGCDATLKRMNRRYTSQEYREAVEKIRAYFDKPAITTDVIAGFPGETQEEFAKTYAFLKEMNLYEMHIFPFSRRSGTKAYDMKGQVDKKTKHERTEKLIELSHKNKLAFEEDMLGRVEFVLFEQKQEEYYHGYTENYVAVYVKTQENISGQIHEVRLTHIEEEKVVGEIVG